MTLLDSQMTLYKYELEYHQALTEYEKNVASLGAAAGRALLSKGGREMKRFTLFILLLVLPGLISGCGKGKEANLHKEHQEEVKKGEDLDMKSLTMESIQKEGKVKEVAPGTVQISPEKQQLIGVKIGTAEMKPLEKVIRTVGRVDYDEKRIVTVSPKIGGWIEDLFVDFTGKYVMKGEPLLTIYSPELVSTQEEYLIALRAKKDLAKSPFPEVAGSGNSLAESAKRRLKLWDISDDQIKALEESGQIKKTLTLHSPFSGFVLEKAAYNGMNVMPGMALFKLADLSVVWLYADIYEYELPFHSIGAASFRSIILYSWRNIHWKSNLHLSFSESRDSNRKGKV